MTSQKGVTSQSLLDRSTRKSRTCQVTMESEFVPDWQEVKYLRYDWLERVARVAWTSHNRKRKTKVNTTNSQ